MTISFPFQKIAKDEKFEMVIYEYKKLFLRSPGLTSCFCQCFCTYLLRDADFFFSDRAFTSSDVVKSPCDTKCQYLLTAHFVFRIKRSVAS